MQALLPLALFAAEQLMKHAPALFAQFKEIIAKEGVTIEELQAERERVASQTYEQQVPNTQLPPE